ncbi:YgiW/YdeI family stress tolerance OB fold protein [Pseudoxanthomonas suwonensis]|uniref:Bacterial OB-fold domain-containing protein n=1 Tax=Pseudoxanthomonas suwonensis TaxID=314722 RepID=A0A0E3Z0R9_9GAMM|nr:NirD/YgiW/YdeI family stress tolerance protein [Pseudoxanthomonas suwonensis]AKC86739.1 hypothetical protein WQ53_08200 [Pseudoxanthomonas suwonensis]
MKKTLAVLVLCLSTLLASAAMAQFTGPSASGRPSTVAEARDVRLGSYVTLTGHIVNHQRSDYFTFRDDTGEIRVEISSGVWGGRKVGPETQVRLMGEVDRGPAGRYIWVKTLDVL